MGRQTRQILSLILIVTVFALLNGSLYLLLTRRLSNNFSGVSQLKMVDVGAYLPHEPDSDLVRMETSLQLTGELPVLDGAAALLPVYAAVVDNLYPVGSVTYEGGVFSDDNYYGENFAADSKLQYRNTVRGFDALLDGTADILFSAAPSESQLQAAAAQGAALVQGPIGREAFVFFVNEKNPVENLTTEQVRDIYSGEITNWSQVGGPERLIYPVTRVEGSGSQSAMERFMGDRKIARRNPIPHPIERRGVDLCL